MAGNPKNQAESRIELDILDQHVRQWHTSLEERTGEPTGGYNKCGWDDPLKHTPNFLEMVKGRVMGMGWSLIVLWDKWIIQNTKDEEEWYRSLIQIAGKVYSVIDPAKVPFLENDPVVRSLAGPKPWPSSKVLKAAKAGDRQFLGFEPLDLEHRKALGISTLSDHGANVADASSFVSAIPSDTAKATIPTPPDTYPEFVSWAMTHVPECKGDLTAVARHWKEHKANMAAV